MVVIYALFWCHVGLGCQPTSGEGQTFSTLRECQRYKIYVEHVTTYAHNELVCMKRSAPAWSPAG